MASILLKRPVAFRWQNMAGVWCFNADETKAAAMTDDYQGLYVRDGTAIVAEWQSIETAPTGDDEFYLVCCNDPLDDRPPFVVRGSIFKSARVTGTPSHLSLHHLTHWMPLPDKPQKSATAADCPTET